MAQSAGDERPDEDAGEGPSFDGGGAPPGVDSSNRNRRWAALFALPFLLLGLGNASLILIWGINPLWAFAQLPPILFTTVLTYMVFRTDFLDDR
ncbi:MAG: hypothetical protein ABEH60_04850 [Halonotius sp.]